MHWVDIGAEQPSVLVFRLPGVRLCCEKQRGVSMLRGTKSVHIWCCMKPQVGSGLGPCCQNLREAHYNTHNYRDPEAACVGSKSESLVMENQESGWKGMAYGYKEAGLRPG